MLGFESVEDGVSSAHSQLRSSRLAHRAELKKQAELQRSRLLLLKDKLQKHEREELEASVTRLSGLQDILLKGCSTVGDSTVMMDSNFRMRSGELHDA